MRLRAEEDEGRPIEPSKATPTRVPIRVRAPRDRRAADDGRGDHLELQPGAGVGIDVAEPDGVQQGGQAASAPSS